MEKEKKDLEEKVQLECRDFLVSGEKFKLISDDNSEILRTWPVPENLEFYYQSKDYISHTDSSKGITEKIYQLVKRYMLAKKLSWIETFKNPGKILDVGAGTGEFLNYCKKKGWKIDGVEPNASARKLASKKGVEIHKELAELPAASFDVITMWHVLEHLPDLETEIRNLNLLLKPDGILIIAVPNFKSYDAQYYKEYWAAYDLPRHLWHFSQKGLTGLIKNFGWNLETTKPLKFDAFYVSLLSEKNKPGSGNFLNAFLRGAISNIKASRTGEYSSLVYFFKKQ